jgi:hypothetical protein
MHPTTREYPPIVRVGVTTRDFPKNFNPAHDSNWTVDNDTQRLYYRPDRLFLKTLAGLIDLRFSDVRPQIVQERYCSCVGRNKCVYGQNPYTVTWKPDYDYYLSLDDDIYLQPGQFLEMLDCAEENPGACVTALYRDTNAIDPETEQYALGNFFMGEPVCFSDKIILADVGAYEFSGLGAMLIPAAVIKVFEFPIFRHGIFSCQRTDPQDPRRSVHYFLEAQDDVGFCRQLSVEKIHLLLKGWAQHRDLLPGAAVQEYLKNH